jgi:hypothetical protein
VAGAINVAGGVLAPGLAADEAARMTDATDALRTGTYSKTLTFTLSTTTP